MKHEKFVLTSQKCVFHTKPQIDIRERRKIRKKTVSSSYLAHLNDISSVLYLFVNCAQNFKFALFFFKKDKPPCDRHSHYYTKYHTRVHKMRNLFLNTMEEELFDEYR